MADVVQTVLLAKKQLAERGHESTRTIERRMQTGDGPPFIRAGRKALFDLNDVIQWERAHTFSSIPAERGAKLLPRGLQEVSDASEQTVETIGAPDQPR